MSNRPDQSGIYGPDAGRRTPEERPATAPSSPTPVPTESNAYLHTKVMTASPAELRLMLIDGAIRFSEQARTGIAQSNHEEAFTGFSKARAIVTELIAGLNPDVSAELCDRLMGLYTFIFTRLVEASGGQSVEILDEVLQLLRFERETWSMLVENLASENASAALVSDTPSAVPPCNAENNGTSAKKAVAGRICTTG